MDQPARILIVDDQDIGRSTLHALLRDEGYLLAFAENGHEALRQAEELQPDLILLDIILPDINGVEVCRRLRAMPRLAEVPILLITTLNDRKIRINGIAAGADDYIAKPYDKLELQTRVRTITRLNRYRRLMLERLQRQQAEAEAERHARDVRALHEADHIKNTFISHVAHEIRSPLTIITLTSDNLDHMYDQLRDDQRKQMLGQLRKQVGLLNELVSNVLDIARLDDQSAPLVRQNDFAALIRDEIDQYTSLAAERFQSLTLENGPAMPVLGNANELRQIVRNLLSNAVKFTPAHGDIRCTYAILQADHSALPVWPEYNRLPRGTWAAFRVTDTGIGIAPADLPNIFERFYRVHQQAPITGSGLGLAITRELVQRYGGAIGVTSNLGEGTTFACYLPLFKEEHSDD